MKGLICCSLNHSIVNGINILNIDPSAYPANVVTTLSQRDLSVVVTLQSYVAATNICGLPDWL